jgi:hypothetical protein
MVEVLEMDGLGDPEAMEEKHAEERKAAQEAMKAKALSLIMPAKKSFTIFKQRILPTLEAEGLKPGKAIMVESAKRWKVATKTKSDVWAECEQAAKDDAGRFKQQSNEALSALGMDTMLPDNDVRKAELQATA